MQADLACQASARLAGLRRSEQSRTCAQLRSMGSSSEQPRSGARSHRGRGRHNGASRGRHPQPQPAAQQAYLRQQGAFIAYKRMSAGIARHAGCFGPAALSLAASAERWQSWVCGVERLKPCVAPWHGRGGESEICAVSAAADVSLWQPRYTPGCCSGARPRSCRQPMATTAPARADT